MQRGRIDSATLLQDARTYPRFVGGLRRFLRDPMTLDECRSVVRETIAGREQSFLQLLERAVYANPRSPYRALLGHAGAELEDVARLVDSEGLEGALDRLHEAGVHLALDELRGRVPVRRGSLELHFTFADLANPLVTGVFTGRSGGSRSLGRVNLLNFDLFAHQAAYWGAFLFAFGLSSRPFAVWYPPVIPGINLILCEGKLDRRPERWFLPSPLLHGAGSLKEGLLVATASALGRVTGGALPFPRHLPPARAVEVVKWLAEKRDAGTPGLLAATPSSSVRVCLAAAEHGIDISGSFFRMGGEPYTPAKAMIVANAGCDGACHYFLSELGWAGIACADPMYPDDVHVCTDRLAVRQRRHRLAPGDDVGLLSFTSLHPSLPNMFLNAEWDDFGVLEERGCSCPLADLGLSLHLHTIRSVEKLTGEGVSFLGEALIDVVEDLLPSRFGGAPNDYQLVEKEQGGMTRVQVRVSPRLGRIDEDRIVPEILAFLEQDRGGRAMAGLWRAGGTLEVIRAEPLVTRASKVLPLVVAAKD